MSAGSDIKLPHVKMNCRRFLHYSSLPPPRACPWPAMTSIEKQEKLGISTEEALHAIQQ